MKKQILFGDEAREKLLKGANTMADAVSVTLGANGRNVLIGDFVNQDFRDWHLPTKVTKDGVSVSREVELEDFTENRGALLLREASEKTMLECGDGTTTTIVLARAIVNEGIKLIKDGANPMQLKKGIDKAVEDVVKKLKELAIPINDNVEKIRQIATVSANNDEVIGNLIADAFAKIGKDGVIDIEESKGVDTEIKTAAGYKFDKGWAHPLFVMNRGKMVTELFNPYILLYDRPITQMKMLTPIIEKVHKEQRELLIVCDSIDGEALAFLMVNVSQKNIKCCVVNCPTFNSSKRDTMEDIAVVTSATYMGDQKGIALNNATLNQLGEAKKVIVYKDETIIIDGKKNEKEYDDLYANLKMNLVDAKDAEEKEKIEKRIARLQGGIAVISVGGQTETEMKERKDRVDDAVRATKSAIAEGYVAGGGTVFAKLSNTVLDIPLKSPLKQICENAGYDSNEIIKLVIASQNGFGFNALTGQIEDLEKSGIIDPVKVLRCSLQNAASVATMILTSECTIVKTY